MSQFDLRELRNAFGTFLTGVTVVATREEGGIPRGFTANSFTSVSLDPPMVLICVGKAAESLDVFTGASGFAVNILAEDQTDTSGLFASKRSDKFEVAKWKESETGNPLLEGTCAWFDCAREQVIDAGDHVIVLGRVLSFDYNDNLGLGFVKGGYMRLGMERDVARPGPDSIVGAIVEHNSRVLLMTDPKTGNLYVPATGLDGTPGSLRKLQKYLDELDMGIKISSLYAVFEYEDTHQQLIYYRARAEHENGDNNFWPFADIPWDRIDSAPHVTMLKRYIDESQRQRYGIYFGNDRAGSVETLW